MQGEQDQYQEIDLLQLLKVLMRHAAVIAASAVACALIFFLVSQFLITPKYQAEATLYINNSRTSAQADGINASDLQASQSLVDTCIAILDSRAVYDEVIEKTDAGYTYEQLSAMVSAESVNSTELLSITVTSTDPAEAAELANIYAEVTSEKMVTTVLGSNTKSVDRAIVPEKKSSPSIVKNTIMGFLLGLVAAIGIVILLEFINTIIRSEKELNDAVKDVPVLGVVPDFKAFDKRSGRGYERSGNGGYGFGYESRTNRKKSSAEESEYERNGILTGNMPFAFREAYKALRTNIMFSLAAIKRGRIIGVTSADKGDGKSTNSLNTAISIAETGKKVLFLDCDMRLSLIADRLSIKRSPGLSNILVGDCVLEDAVQRLEFGDKYAFDIITAGDFPPNPSELLNSSLMEDLLESFTAEYDYIIADMPPVEIVSDALILAKSCDGLIVVVREGKSEREEIRSTVRKIEFIGGKLLGFIYSNHYEKPKSGRYGKYGKYGKYEKYGGYSDYSKSYDSSYEKANNSRADAGGRAAAADAR